MRIGLRLLAALAALLPAGVVLAQVPNQTVNPCPLGGCTAYGTGVAGLSAYLQGSLLTEVFAAFSGVAFIFFFYYAVRLLLESSSDSIVTETKDSYTYAITGAVIVTVSSVIVATVSNNDAALTLINTNQVSTNILAPIMKFFRLIAGTLVTVIVVVQGVRLIVLANQESEIEKQREKFFHSMIGVAVLLLANSIVNAVVGTTSGGTATATGGNASTLGTELTGIANFLLEILGILTVLAFIAAGVMLVLSADEGLKDRAKKAMYTAVVTFILVFISYMMVNFFFGV